MLVVRVEICRYVDAAFPGWVECRLADASGHQHVFVEKIPVVTADDVHESSVLPYPGTVACILLEKQEHKDGRQIVLIDTARPWGIESTAGLTQFYVFSEQLFELPRENAVEQIAQSRGLPNLALRDGFDIFKVLQLG